MNLLRRFQSKRDAGICEELSSCVYNFLVKNLKYHVETSIEMQGAASILSD